MDINLCLEIYRRAGIRGLNNAIVGCQSGRLPLLLSGLERMGFKIYRYIDVDIRLNRNAGVVVRGPCGHDVDTNPR